MTKRVEFRGQMLTVREIATLTGLHHRSVEKRLQRGISLEAAPRDCRNHPPEATSEAEMVIDDRYYFDEDLGAQVALRLCGGQCTLSQLSALYGVSWQAMQQVEQRALRAFKEGMERLGLLDAMLENMRSRNAIRRESYADRADRMAPGKIDLGDWKRTHGTVDLARLSGRESEVCAAAVEYSRRGARRRGARTRAA